ncbi:hypothetical protein AB1Y20_009612 [Prymnesium parvum]|uniref:DUF659 domain-containing protein n=1 Tax=Prymnesium parvum TaxID=97485 RepID=A0AB34K0W4_PRYPA
MHTDRAANPTRGALPTTNNCTNEAERTTTTGLEKPFLAAGNGTVRAAAKKMPIRNGQIWDLVSVIENEKAFGTAPELICKDCEKRFAGGVSRIKNHIIKQCKCSTEALRKLKEELLVKAAIAEDETSKKKKAEAVDISAEGATGQRNVETMLSLVTAEKMDDAIADFIYGEGLPFSLVESPQFKAMLTAAKSSASSYKPPSQVRIAGELLDKSVKRLKVEEQPIRKACTVHGCTVVSDGWEDCAHNHLINFLVASNQGAFFDGTVMLAAGQREDAVAVARLIEDEIERVGPLSVVQVVTDTCSTMKAAWKIIERHYPWITCTCCAPHVLSLLLKDISKIPAVASVLSNVKKVLSRFWGRKRWRILNTSSIYLSTRVKTSGRRQVMARMRWMGKAGSRT